MLNFGIGMKKIRLKKFKRNEKGISVIALIVAILLLGSIGYIMSSLMSRSQESVPRTLDSTNAFSLVQGGVNYTGKYLTGVTDWSILSGTLTKSLATGTFTIQWGAYDSGIKTITATITGASGSANRRVTTIFKKFGSALAIRSRGGISIKTGSWLDCDPSDSSNPLCTGGTCVCTQANVSLPTVWFSTTPPALPIACNMSNAGNYSGSSGKCRGIR